MAPGGKAEVAQDRKPGDAPAFTDTGIDAVAVLLKTRGGGPTP